MKDKFENIGDAMRAHVAECERRIAESKGKPRPLNPNCLSHWFPKIRDAGLPVPRTEIIATDVDLLRLCDGVVPDGYDAFIEQLTASIERMGNPCFLRTGCGSGKHNWQKTCYVAGQQSIAQHVWELVEWSELCGMFGELPYDVWCVRELLPTIPQMVADIYGNMPVCREFRFFVKDGEVKCWHPYWPKDSLVDGMTEPPADFDYRYLCLCYMPANDTKLLHSLASRAGEAVGGEWSVDILETKRGWYVTDMALANQSWHWPECVS